MEYIIPFASLTCMDSVSFGDGPSGERDANWKTSLNTGFGPSTSLDEMGMGAVRILEELAIVMLR